MNVLVIAPHPDDETIGCGGTISLHRARGDKVSVVFLSSGELGLRHLPREEAWRVRESEAEAAAEVLGISSLAFLRQPDWFAGDDIGAVAKLLIPLLERDSPQTIYLSHADEWHPDHRAALPIVRAALRGIGLLEPALLSYEVWTPLAEPDYVQDISTVFQRKLEAVGCYRSQLTGFRYDRAIQGLNQYRGALYGRCDFAEAFRYVEIEGPDDVCGRDEQSVLTGRANLSP